MCHCVAHEVDAASLPGGAEYLGDGCLQSLMRIGDDKLGGGGKLVRNGPRSCERGTRPHHRVIPSQLA
jgi:hypothetical protein